MVQKCEVHYFLWCIGIRRGLIIGANLMIIDFVILVIIFFIFAIDCLTIEKSQIAWYMFTLVLYLTSSISLLVAAIHKSAVSTVIYLTCAIITFLLMLGFAIHASIHHKFDSALIAYFVYYVFVYCLINLYTYPFGVKYYRHLMKLKTNVHANALSREASDYYFEYNYWHPSKPSHLIRNSQSGLHFQHASVVGI